MDGYELVQVMTVSISIPTEIESNGKREVVPAEIVEKAAKDLRDELKELNFGELAKTTIQSALEENCLRFRPHADVVVEGGDEE